MKKIVIFIAIGLLPFSIYSQISFFQPEVEKSFQKVTQLKKEKKDNLALIELSKIRERLFKLNNFENNTVFADYFLIVRQEIDAYKSLNRFSGLSIFLSAEAEKLKPFFVKNSNIINIYYLLKSLVPTNSILGNDTIEERMKASKYLESLLHEVKSNKLGYFKGKDAMIEHVTDSYFFNKIKTVIAKKNQIISTNKKLLKEGKTSKDYNTVFFLEVEKANFQKIITELKKPFFSYFNAKDELIQITTDHIKSINLLFKSSDIAKGKLQKVINNMDKSSLVYDVRKNENYFEDELDKIRLLADMGMYNTRITSLNNLASEIAKANFSNDKDSIAINFQLNSSFFFAFKDIYDYENAENHILKASDYYRNLEPIDKNKIKFDSNLFLSNLKFNQKKYNKALELVLLVNTNHFENLNGYIANLFYWTKNYNKAIEYNKKHIEYLNNFGDSRSQSSLSITCLSLVTSLFIQKKYNEVEKYLKLVNLKSLRERGGPAIQSYYGHLAELKLNQGLVKEANKAMIGFISEFENSFFSSLLDKFEASREVETNWSYDITTLSNYLDRTKQNSNLLVAHGYTLAILSKQALLTTNLTISKSIQSTKNSELQKILLQRTEVTKKLKNLNVKNKDSLLDLSRLYEKELVVRSNSSILELFKKNKVDWLDVKNQLNEGDVSIEFVSYSPNHYAKTNKSRKYAAFVLTKKSKYPHFIKLCKEEELKEIIESSKLKNSSSYDITNHIYIENGAKIYDLIWKPIEKYLSKAQNIYFAPSGLLNGLSFSSLKAKNEKLFLFEKYNLIQLISTKKINNNVTVKTHEKVILFGDIDYSGGNIFLKNKSTSNTRGVSFVPLNGTKKEIEDIQNISQSNNVESSTYNQQDATEENLKKAIKTFPDILHIATHAFYLKPIEDEFFTTDLLGMALIKRNKNPMNRSGLVFTGANRFWKHGGEMNNQENDGILTANEISTFNMENISLVVLSACETGLGETLSNEGVFGLQRGLKIAGVKNMIVSLWKVDDKVTQEYMTEFYRTLFEKNASIQEAYFETQKIIKNKYPEPYYWAAFVLTR